MFCCSLVYSEDVSITINDPSSDSIVKVKTIVYKNAVMSYTKGSLTVIHKGGVSNISANDIPRYKWKKYGFTEDGVSEYNAKQNKIRKANNEYKKGVDLGVIKKREKSKKPVINSTKSVVRDKPHNVVKKGLQYVSSSKIRYRKSGSKHYSIYYKLRFKSSGGSVVYKSKQNPNSFRVGVMYKISGTSASVGRSAMRFYNFDKIKGF